MTKLKPRCTYLCRQVRVLDTGSQGVNYFTLRFNLSPSGEKRVGGVTALWSYFTSH